MANQEAVGRSTALLLQIKALALQKRPLFVLFALVGRTAAILDWQCYAHRGVRSAKQGNYLKYTHGTLENYQEHNNLL